MKLFPSTTTRRVLGLVAIGTLIIVAGASAAADTRAADPRDRQITALKRQVTTLKRQVARLKAQNGRLRTQLAAVSPAGVARQLEQAKAALDKYQSVDAARADGYAAASPCESSPEGGMGFHYVSGAAMGDGRLDPVRPEILLYAPGPTGLQLIGAEYFKPDADQNLATDDDRPSLFGRTFDGPFLGHAPGMPIHYDLHVWFWKRNPMGMFAIWNPDVRC
jgi:hypothetical protein